MSQMTALAAQAADHLVHAHDLAATPEQRGRIQRAINATDGVQFRQAARTVRYAKGFTSGADRVHLIAAALILAELN